MSGQINPLKLIAIVGTFTAVIGAVMYPIYFYPIAHIDEYSEYKHNVNDK
jgi:hypothetical protein